MTKKAQARELPDDLMLADVSDAQKLKIQKVGVFDVKYFPSRYCLASVPPTLDLDVPYHMIGQPWLLGLPAPYVKVNKQLKAGYVMFAPFRTYGGNNLFLRTMLSKFNGTNLHWNTIPLADSEGFPALTNFSQGKSGQESAAKPKVAQLTLDSTTHNIVTSTWADVGDFPSIVAYGVLPDEVSYSKTGLPFVPSQWTVIQRKDSKDFDFVLKVQEKNVETFMRFFCLSVGFYPLACDKMLRQELNVKLPSKVDEPFGVTLLARFISQAHNAETVFKVADTLFQACFAAGNGAKDDPAKLAKKDLGDMTFTAVLLPERFLPPPDREQGVNRWLLNENLDDSGPSDVSVSDVLSVVTHPSFGKIEFDIMKRFKKETFTFQMAANKDSLPQYISLTYTPSREVLKRVAKHMLNYCEDWFDMDKVSDDIFPNAYDPRDEINSGFRFIVQGKNHKRTYRPGSEKGGVLSRRNVTLVEIESIFREIGISGADDSGRASETSSKKNFNLRSRASKDRGGQAGAGTQPVEDSGKGALSPVAEKQDEDGDQDMAD